MKLPMLSANDKLAEIRRLYFNTTRQTLKADLAKAPDLLKSMASEDERERATVYMHGLAEMGKDWRAVSMLPLAWLTLAWPSARRRSSRLMP